MPASYHSRSLRRAFDELSSLFRAKGLSLVLACGIAGLVSLSSPGTALGQTDAATGTPSRRSASSSALGLSFHQIEAFAGLVDEPVGAVADRLRCEPSLVPIAAEAADSRLRRKKIGKWMMVGGFSLYGLGGGIAVYGILHYLGGSHSWCVDGSCTQTSMSTQDRAFAIGGPVTAGVGLLLAIPGIVVSARQSAVEAAALSRYEQSNRPYEPPSLSHRIPRPGSAGDASVPLLAFSF
jgi:hypothetical protein